MADTSNTKGRLGILVGGGPAPGINGVIGAAAIEGLQHGVEVLGLYDGFKWLAEGDTSHVKPLTVDDVTLARFRGGSILRTSRKNPTANKAEMRKVVATLRKLGIRYLVTIGGDDTAFSACKTSEYAKGTIRVAHVPKTIDNDLPLPGHMPTFGYQTARALGGQLVGNLVEDARTTNRWYVVVAMGRSAGHLAMGMGVAGGAALTLIPEEFGKTVSLATLCHTIEAAMLKASVQGREYGVVVLAEGIADLLIGELKNEAIAVVKNDEAGHLRLGEVPLALIVKRRLQQRADERGEQRTFVDATVGYELRCADPIAYDVDYTQQLGWGAIAYLLDPGQKRWPDTGRLIAIEAGELKPLRFADILDPKTGKTTVRRVDTSSVQYRAARAYMTRLEREDLENPRQLRDLARAARLAPAELRRKYARLVGLRA